MIQLFVQLLAALESLREFQTEDSRPVSKLADQTSSGPPVLVAELVSESHVCHVTFLCVSCDLTPHVT